MDTDLLLGIDVGTHGVKAALVQPSGKILAQTQVEHSTYSPQPDWVEQDMVKDWWEDPVRVIRKVLQMSGVDSKQIKAIGVSGLYPALGPTDGEGNPLRRAILYSDNRSVAEVEEVNRDYNLRLSSEELTPKLIWFLRNEPELASKMRMFFDAHHYLIYKLTGSYVTDTITTGLHGAIYESPIASWRPDVCAHFGIPFDILPAVNPPAHISGLVNQQAAELTGLAEGTPVMSGSPDLYASMLSAGAVHTWESIAYYGSGGVLPVLKDEALNAAFVPFPVAERGGKVQEGYLYDYPVYCLSVGDGVHWFREHFGATEIEAAKGGGLSSYARLDQLAAEVPVGSDGLILLPYFQGQRSPDFDPWATGVYFGMKKGHGRGHFFRALLESWGYSIRYGLESTYPGGNPLRRLVATGGGAGSPLWRQIVSDITGLPQDYVEEADGPLGAAYIAGLAIGMFSNFDSLQRDWVKVSATTQPDPESQKIYDQYYQIFKELHPTLKAVHKHLHEVQTSIGVEQCGITLNQI